MKKTIAFFLLMASLLSVASCGVAVEESTSAETTTVAQTTAETLATETTPAQTTSGETTSQTTSAETTTEETTTAYTEPESEYISGVETLDKYVDYKTAQAEFDAKRDAINNSDSKFDGFEQYLPNDPTAKGLLTQSEINALRQDGGNGLRTVTYEQAVADIDLYFRMLKYAYGAYYYFGGDEAFYEAKQNVLNAIKGKAAIRGEELGNILYQNLLFVRDAHFRVNFKSPTNELNVRYEYYYCMGQNYVKDEIGYYKLIDGVKWYYAGCENEAVSMEYSLDEEGHIVYSLVRFCPIMNEDGFISATDEIFLKNGDIIKKQAVTWQKSVPYGTCGMDYHYLKENGIAYISVREFDTINNSAELSKYSSTGADVKDAKVIIYDTRSNCGGGNGPSRNWIKNFSGITLTEKGAFSIRINALWTYNNCALGAEHDGFDYFDGIRIKNDIPIIFLTDDLSGSAGESVWRFTTCLENVTVIGSNTNGCQICGNMEEFYLPNSKLHVQFGQGLRFINEIKNVDGIGYEPDIWCNPADALDIALKMIVTQGLASETDVEALKKKIPDRMFTGVGNFELRETDRISIFFDDTTSPYGPSVSAKESFSVRGDFASVRYLGLPITDFTVEVLDETLGTIEVVDGKLKFNSLTNKKRCVFRIYYNGEYSEFYWTTSK